MLILCTLKTWCDGGSLSIKIIIVIRSTLPERMSGLFRNAVAKLSGIGKALPHSIFIESNDKSEEEFSVFFLLFYTFIA